MYITTAIDYANGTPHLGHAYEKVLADVLARVGRLQGQSVHFLTGLDEHGQKVQQAAQANLIEPQVYCDVVAEDFQGLCASLNITNDDYIRTTQERHKKVVADILQRLYDEGVLYKAEYTGYYSVRSEQFVQEKDKLEDGSWPQAYGEVTELTESNYFFRLSLYQNWLIGEIESRPDWIYPAFRRSEVLSFLKEPINDLCISRPTSRLSWGIPLPFDTDYVAYVWFDALINYISAIDYPNGPDFSKKWENVTHVIGKDILVPPHAVYWPIMLHAMGLPLPKRLVVHGWWLLRGEKMSKSEGPHINPLDLIRSHGSDAFRYFVMRDMVLGQDSDFRPEAFNTRYTSELGNDLGNLVSRLLHMMSQYRQSITPQASVHEAPEAHLQTLWAQTAQSVPAAYEALQIHKALEDTFAFVRGINRYAEARAPWKQAKLKTPDAQALVDTTLATMAEALRLAATLLAPVLASTSPRILELLGHAPDPTWKSLDWNPQPGARTGAKVALFPRL